MFLFLAIKLNSILWEGFSRFTTQELTFEIHKPLTSPGGLYLKHFTAKLTDHSFNKP